ncbi:DUF2029 domain-containing protein [Candidatus Dojkabacteria bacterium]|nr:DUF2029 domain-containing protein [Candidatus Dojkabacteria bacterium]
MISKKNNFQSVSLKNVAYGLLIIFMSFLYLFNTIERIKKQEFGLDYLAFWSTGKIAEQYGFSRIYDPILLNAVQVDQLSMMGYSIENYQYIPVPYPSVFITPFALLSKLDFYVSYCIWIITNWAMLFVYLLFFTRQILKGKQFTISLLFPLLSIILSYPTLFNFVWGQMEVILVVVIGEFIRSGIKNKPFSAGLWLGSLILKPQLLIIVIPLFFLSGELKLIKGVLLSGLALIVASLGLSGINGIIDMLTLWLNLVPGMPSIAPTIMMNWRMLGLHSQVIIPELWSWVIIASGMVGTLIICWMMFKQKPEFGSTSWVLLMIGFFGATLMFSWHSHIHMAMVLIPFFIFGLFRMKEIIPLIDLWVFIPAFYLMVFLFIMNFVIKIEYLESILVDGHYVIALIYLFLNIRVCLKVLQLLKQDKLNNDVS